MLFHYSISVDSGCGIWLVSLRAGGSCCILKLVLQKFTPIKAWYFFRDLLVLCVCLCIKVQFAKYQEICGKFLHWHCVSKSFSGVLVLLMYYPIISAWPLSWMKIYKQGIMVVGCTGSECGIPRRQYNLDGGSSKHPEKNGSFLEKYTQYRERSENRVEEFAS